MAKQELPVIPTPESQPSPGRTAPGLGASPRLLLGLALGLAAWAQWWLDRRMHLGVALGLYLLGAVLYALTNPLPAHLYGPSAGTGTQSPSWSLHRAYLLWAVLFAALAVLGLDRDNRALGLLSWAVSILLCFLALPPRPRSADPREKLIAPAGRGRWLISWKLVGLGVALVLGFALRVYRLAELPADLGPEAPQHYYAAQRLLREGAASGLATPAVGELFYYLAAALARLGCLSPYSLRLTSALVGTATIPALYFLAAESLGYEAGVWAALLLAVNKWHILLSRMGDPISLVPLGGALLLYFVARGLRRGHPRDWAWGGLVLGLGAWAHPHLLYGVFLVVGCGLLYGALCGRRKSRRALEAVPSPCWPQDLHRLLAGIGLLFLVTLVVAGPWARSIAATPRALLLPASSAPAASDAAILATAEGGVPLPRILLGLALLNLQGDTNPRHGVPLERELGFLSSTLLVLGCATALARPRRGAHILVLLGLLTFWAPLFVSLAQGNRVDSLLAAGTVIPALVLAALALTSLRAALRDGLERLLAQTWRARPLVVAMVPVILVGALWWGEAGESSRDYFYAYRRLAPDVANYSLEEQLARRMVAFREGPSYVKPWPQWYDRAALNVHLDAAGRGPAVEIERLAPDAPPLAGFQGKMLMLLAPQDKPSLATLQAYFVRWAVLGEAYPGGEPAFIAFYGEK